MHRPTRAGSAVLGFKSLAVAALLALAGSGPSFAQQAAPVVTPTAAPDAALAAQRCTGVLCDAYYAMHPNARPGEGTLPCHDFICGMFGGQKQTPMPQAQPIAQQAPMPEPMPHRTHRKKRHVAAAHKAAATATAAATPADAAAR